MDWAEQMNEENERDQNEERWYVVALGDVHERGVESLCVGEAA